jgi:exosortase D (VPLPA-CTERM-specific)
MNALRIGVIGVLVDRYGIGQAEGFLHFFEGWIIFLSCIGLLFLMVLVMQRLSGDRRPLGEAIDLDFTGLGGQLARVGSIVPARALIAAALLTAALSAAWTFAPARQADPMMRDPLALFPLSIDGWEGSTALLAPNVEETLGADDYVSAFFRAPGEAEGVDLFVSYYASQTRCEAIHSPAVCLPGAGWEVAAIRPMEVSLPGTRFGTFTLNRALIQKGLERQLVYYWFEGRGRRVTNDFAAKFHTVADGLTIGRTDGGLVRVITPIGADGEAGADARLLRFLGASVDHLDRFIPE